MPGLGAIEVDSTAVVEPSRRDSEPPIKGLYCNERMVQSNMLMVGVKVSVITRDGRQFSGILYSMSPEYKIVLGLAHEVKHEDLPPAAHDIFQKLIFEPHDIVSVQTQGEVEAFVKSGFATDSAVSGYVAVNGEAEKELEQWDPEEYGDGDALEMHSTKLSHGNGNHNAPGWHPDEMFSKNEALGVKTTFKEDLSQYTSVMPDQDFNTPEFAKRREAAAAIARQIEENPCSQRNAKLENDDEEKDITAWNDPNRNERGARGGRGGRVRGNNMRGTGGNRGGGGMYNNRSMPRGGGGMMMDSPYRQGGGARYGNQNQPSPHNQAFDQWTQNRTKQHRSRDGEYGGHSGPGQSPGSDHAPSANRRGAPHGHPESATLPRTNKKPERVHLEGLRAFGDNFKLGASHNRMPSPQQQQQQQHMGGPRMHPPNQPPQHTHHQNAVASSKLYSAAASVGLSPRQDQSHDTPPINMNPNQDVGDGGGGNRYPIPNMQVPPPPPPSVPPPASPPVSAQPPGMDQEKTPDNRMDTSAHSSTSGKKFSLNPDAPTFTPRSTPGSGNAPSGSVPTTPAASIPAVAVGMPSYPPPTPSPAQTAPSFPVYAQQATSIHQPVSISGQGIYAPVPPMSLYQQMPSQMTTIQLASYAPSIMHSGPNIQSQSNNTTTASVSQQRQPNRKGSQQMVSSMAGQPLVQPSLVYPSGPNQLPQQFVMPTYQANIPQQSHMGVQPSAQYYVRNPTPTAFMTQGPPTSEHQHGVQYMHPNNMTTQYIVQPNNQPLQHPPPSSSNTSSMSGPLHMQQMQQQPPNHSNNASQPPTPGPHPAPSPAYQTGGGQPVYGHPMVTPQSVQYAGAHPAMGQPMMMYNPSSGYNQIITATPNQPMQYYAVVNPLQQSQHQYQDQYMQQHMTPLVRSNTMPQVIMPQPPNISAPAQSSNG